MSKKDIKILVLTKIRDSKDILFGKFTKTHTKAKKVEEWTKICEFAKAVGQISQDRDYSFVRDVYWSNIKRATLAKIDHAHQTGSAGGKIKKMTPIDDLVIEIIGTESPIMEVPEKKNTENSAKTKSKEVEPSTFQINASQKKIKRILTENSSARDEHLEETEMKKIKVELELEALILKNHKMKLEILELERRLNIPASKYTAGLVNEPASSAMADSNDNISTNENEIEFVDI